MNYDHVQLDPSVNRVRVPRGSVGPAAPARTPHTIDQPLADPENPYRNTHLGWFSDTITDDKGRSREYGFYIPETMKTSGNMVLVFIPGKTAPLDFFKASAWKETLERYCMTAYFLSAADGWDMEDPGSEIDAAVKVFAEMRSLEYFPSNASGVYAAGFGCGAGIASIFAVLYQSYLAGFAAWGCTEMDSLLLDKLGNSASDCDAFKKRGEIPLPAYFVGKASNTTEYFKKACNTSDDYLSNGIARIYREIPRPGSSYVNDEVCSEVWVTSDEDADKLGKDIILQKMIGFLESHQRWAGEGSGHIRKTMLAERDLGMIRTDAEINGLKRYWYTFEPTAYKRKAQEKFPLVIAIHGFSCSGEFFAQNSGWHRVGEERNFFVLYPTAYPFTVKTEKNPVGIVTLRGTATPRWNSGMFGQLPMEDAPDDVDFIRQMVDATLAKYPEIDTERIYVTGHSNGSMMTQLLMRRMPERFAGFAPVGAMECMREKGVAPTDGIKRNVWYTIGEFDGMGCSLEGENGNTLTLKMMCEANGLDYDSAKHYSTGIYNHTIIRDAEKVPMVRFTGVTNFPHTYTPELAFMIYDEFFSQFVRHADGTLEYLA